MNDEQIKQLADRMIHMLPNDKNWALTAMTICLAKVVKATGCPNEVAINMFRDALNNTSPSASQIIRPERGW